MFCIGRNPSRPSTVLTLLKRPVPRAASVPPVRLLPIVSPQHLAGHGIHRDCITSHSGCGTPRLLDPAVRAYTTGSVCSVYCSERGVAVRRDRPGERLPAQVDGSQGAVSTGHAGGVIVSVIYISSMNRSQKYTTVSIMNRVHVCVSSVQHFIAYCVYFVHDHIVQPYVSVVYIVSQESCPVNHAGLWGAQCCIDCYFLNCKLYMSIGVWSAKWCVRMFSCVYVSIRCVCVCLCLQVIFRNMRLILYKNIVTQLQESVSY